MAFNSTDYVLFMVAIFALFWRLARLPRLRVWFLLGASYLFYTAWNGWLVGLILLSSAIDYICGGLIARLEHGRLTRKLLLGISVCLNLALLCFFKYFNFFSDNASSAFGLFGLEVSAAHLDVILPVGISFYTFQSMSYSIDIYRGVMKPARSLPDFLLFVSFFPQLIAGPIVRAREFLPQLEREPELDQEVLINAFYRLLRGFAKKMVIADYLAATIVDPFFRSPADASGIETLVALTGFHFQVYCDFSGYTDIAIASAALFGFTLPENFKTPYAAHTPANYWSRWHLTLSRFCFDYVYKPLGGNRHGWLRTHLNTVFAFTIIGFWHGANWTFVLFGVYHSLGVIGTRLVTGLVARLRGVERQLVEAELEGRPLPIIATNLFVIGSLALFRSPDIATAWIVYGRLLQWDTLALVFSWGSLAVLAAAVATHYLPERWEQGMPQWLWRRHPLMQGLVVFVVALGILHAATVTHQSFVYFQF